MSELQSISATSSGSQTFIALAYGGILTADSLLWAVVYWNDPTLDCSVADPTNGAWTPIGTKFQGAGGNAGFCTQMFYKAHNGDTTALLVTATLTGSTSSSRGLAIHEYSPGTPNLSEFHYLNSAGGNTSAVTPVTVGDVVCGYNFVPGSTSDNGGGFVLREHVNWGSNATEDHANSAVVAGTPISAPFVADSDNSLGIACFTVSAGPTTQIIAPSADVSTGAWLAEPGDGTSNLWDQINEGVLSATDYVQSSQSPVSPDILKVRIASLQAPAKPRVDGTFHFRVDHLKDVVGGDNMQLTVKLYAADGTTLIKAWTPITVGAETTSDLTLTGAEADTIPDADFAVGLVLAFEALKV